MALIQKGTCRVQRIAKQMQDRQGLPLKVAASRMMKGLWVIRSTFFSFRTLSSCLGRRQWRELQVLLAVAVSWDRTVFGQYSLAAAYQM